MQHPNKNRLLEYFYKEGSDQEILKTREHLHSCLQCQGYLKSLENTATFLDQLQEEKPEPKTFNLILDEIKPVQQKPIREKQFFLAFPYFQIALSIPFILAIIYFLQSRLSLLPIWESLEKVWIVQTIGSFGVVTILFFLVGSFITLTLAPILLYDSESNNPFKHALKFSWR